MVDKENKEYLNKVADGLTSRGLTIGDLLKSVSGKNFSFLQPSDKAFQHFTTAFDKLEAGDYSQKTKGKLLEELISALFKDGYPALFEVRRNCKTSSNEIDLQLNWTQAAEKINFLPIGNNWGDSFLCECKNYADKAGVTYVGKFYSLMCYTKTTLGLFISWNGVTGENNSWKDSLGLIKKLALGDNKYIIVLNKDDLKKIRNQETNIFDLIREKYIALKNDIDYSKFIQENGKHEIEINKSW
ncbi:restriction endonuclease [Lactobacillus intestinalis]|uniref:restriction endonuclease n=1 Tax=Lactobacillus intestinalis TaxID=151781 RepID=UPI0026050823|nr:restriction endonuclease [Lactobacillus intestinalis]